MKQLALNHCFKFMAKPNIYFFYGPDTYRSLGQLKTWTNAFLAKFGQGSVREIKSLTEPVVLSELVSGVSLFNPSVLTVVRNPFPLGDEPGAVNIDDLLRMIEEGMGADQNLILFQAGNLDSRLNAVKKIKTLGKEGKLELKEFPNLEGEAALKFIANEFKKNDLQIERRAAVTLSQFTSTPAGTLDSWRAVNAVSQLSYFAKGRGLIKEKDVLELIPPQGEPDVFWPLIQSFSQGKKGEFLKNLDTILRGTDSDFELLGVMSALFEQVKNMLIVSRLQQSGLNTDDMDELLDFKKGRSKYVLRDAKGFSEAKLTELMDEIILTEARFKQGKTLLAPALAGMKR